MRRNFDIFMSELRRKKTQRRRMLSLLLVLSLFVTSGVSWALHGVGMTMANEAECGIEEHSHTESCYENVLICGLEENETHTHNDTCYEMQLVCEKDEHIHDIGCFTGEETSPEDAALLTAESADSTEPEEFALCADDPGYEGEDVSGYEGMFRAAANEAGESGEGEGEGGNTASSGLPPTIETIDNIAEGIKFTLFDYGNSALESENNHYGYVWDDENHVWTHPNANTTDGINAGRTLEDDILFFAYGTPVDQYVRDPDVYNYFDDNNVHHYMPDKNSYSGDYNSDPRYSGNRPVSGIVSNTLPTNRTTDENGYPTVNTSAGHSLAYLFNPDPKYDADGVRKTYTDVNHFLQRITNEETGVDHLIFNSDHNYAYFNQDTRNFDVYNTTFEIVNKDHHKADTYDGNRIDPDTKEPVYYKDKLDDGFMIGFFPFDQYNENRKDPNYDGDKYNHHFGMTMEASFVNPPYDKSNVKEPITFKYSGDDDMWVYIDGKLVLDIGGIHEPTGGMIDFSNDLVWVQDNELGKTLSEVQSDLGLDSNAWKDLPKPIGIDTQNSVTSENRWIVRPISDFIPAWDRSKPENTEYIEGSHQINMFYLERGGCYSNLAMEMNLPTLKPLTVKKDVDFKHHFVKNLYDNTEYWFQIWEKVGDNWIIPSDISPNPFPLTANGRKTFENLGQTRHFKVVELGADPNTDSNSPDHAIVDPEIYETVSVNDETIPINQDQHVEKDGGLLSETNSYAFENVLKEEFTNITVKKAWDCSDAKKEEMHDFVVKYKIMRTDSVNGEIKQVAIAEEDPVTHIIAKKRVFTLSYDEWVNGDTRENLLSRYGNHFYTYNVEELNIPNGFEPSYSVDDSGAIVITNTDITRKQIHVRKDWENTADPKPQIKLKLTRSRIEYEGSTPTSLTVNILDEAGNLIKTKTISKDDPVKIYAGGSAELAFVLPAGSEVYRKDPAYPQQVPENPGDDPNGKPYVKFEEDEGILAVYNLAEDSNTVTFKVTTDNIADSLLLVHNSFTGNANGWVVQGDGNAYIENTGNTAGNYYAKKDALHVTNRTGTWNGAKLYLDSSKFKMLKTYTFSVYVRSTVEDDFIMTFNNGLGNFKWITNPPVQVGTEWKRLTGTIELTNKIDPYNMFLLLETRSGTADFYVDEFTAVEGSANVWVEPDNGKVHVDSGEATASERVVYNQAFSVSPPSDWTPRGSAETGVWPNQEGYLRIYNRSSNDAGLQKDVSSLLQAGHTYRFELDAQHDGDSNASDYVRMVLAYQDGGSGQWEWLCETDLPDSDSNHYQGGRSTETFPIPATADLSNATLYFETRNQNSFRIRNVKIIDTTPTSAPVTENKSGYTIQDGEYVSDYSNFNIVLDENSVTNPLHKKNDDYLPDPDFLKEIILPNAEGEEWAYHWQNFGVESTDPHFFTEDYDRYLYKYHIEEEWIGSEPNKVGETAAGSGKWVSNDGDYRVTYENNDVATNESGNPIVVTNTYIWYRLPETGGMGVDAIYVSGILLTLTGFLGGYAFKRRERRFR